MPDTPAIAGLAIAEPSASRVDATASSVRIGAALRQVAHDAGARLALAFLALLVLGALLAPWVAPYDPTALHELVALKLHPPSAAHPFGTDEASRDVLSRMLHGSRISLSVAVLSALLAGSVGLLYGTTAGYLAGAVDAVMMRIVDAALSIPRLFLLLLTLALWKDVSFWTLVLILGCTGWFPASRLARAQALSLREREFILAARALGAGSGRIIVRHVLPHTLGPVLVSLTITVAQVIVLEAGLSFLGYGVQQPNPTWGNIIQDGRDSIATAWWLTVFPGLALVGTALAFNTLADRLRAALNPRQLPAP